MNLQRMLITLRIFVFSCAVLFSSTVLGQSLNEAVSTTLRTNPDILASKYNVEAAEQLRKQARSGYFPVVDLIFAGGEETSNNTTTRAASLDPTNPDDLRLTREDQSIKITQLLYDGFSTRNFVKQQAALLDAAIARLGSSQENVSLRAIQVYLEVLRRDAVVVFADENLDQHEMTLDKISERFESGVGTKVDVVQTRGRRAQAKSGVLLTQRDAKNGRAEFFRVVGENPVGLEDPQAITGLPQTLEGALEIASRNNPGIKAAEAELEAAIAARKQARSSFHPKFDLELGATRNEDTDGSPGANDDETAVIRMTYNVFRGGADRARSNETQAREFAARETLRSNRLAVEEDVTLIWNELEDILVRLEYLEAHVKSTEEVLKVYNEQLTLGKRTLLDLLDVQNELLRARIAFVSGQYVALLARYRVLTSTGQLLKTMGITPG
ncbi:MAG: TolC family outer membrane protein [Gammaproteobacteria bacterium]|nr:TolC family outer membrane protein [Gammaproteobacteria bacterium]